MKDTKMYVTCKACGYIHFPITKEHAEKEIEQFNAYFDSLDKEKQYLYYGGKKSSIENYLGCFYCGKKEFRPSTEEEIDRIYGCTINPVIYDI